MSNRYSRTPAPLDLDLTPSRWLRIGRCAAVSMAALALLLASLPWPIRLLLAIALLADVLFARARRPLRRLRFDGCWSASDDSADDLHLRLDDAVIWPALIVLRFQRKPVGRWRPAVHVVLLPDSIDADSWRRLRLYLRHHDVFGDAATDPGRAT